MPGRREKVCVVSFDHGGLLASRLWSCGMFSSGLLGGGGGEKRSRLWDPLGERWGIFSAADGTARHIVPWQRAEHLLAPQARIGGAWLLLRSLPGSWGSLPLAFSQRQGRIGRIGSTFPGAKAPLSHSKRFSLFQQLLRMRLRSPPSAPPRNSARAPPPGRCAGPSAAPVLR